MGRSTTIVAVFLMAALLAAVGAGVFAEDIDPEDLSEGEWASQLLGLSAPNLVVEKEPVQGSPLDQGEFGDHIVSLLFFEIGNNASMEVALTEFSRVANEYSSFDGAVFIGVATCANYEENPERLQRDTIIATLKEKNFGLPVVLDLREKSLARYPLLGRHGTSNAVPITVLIDHGGIVRYHYWLTDELHGEDLEEAVFNAIIDFDLPGYRGVGPKLQAAAEAIKKKDYGKAYKIALKAAASEDYEEASDGQYLFRLLEGALKNKLAKVADLQKRRKLIRAILLLNDTVKKFKDVDGYKEARNLLKSITRSKEYKNHKKAYEAFQRLENFRGANPTLGPRAAKELSNRYAKFALDYSYTEYANLARKRIKRLRAK